MSSSKKQQPKRRRNGEGTIYQLKNGKWVAQVPINGIRKTVASGYDFDKVNAEYERVKVELRNQSYIGKNNKTIGAILEENLQNKERSNKICQSTILRNRETANVIFKDGLSKMCVQQVTRQDIQNFLNNVAQEYSNSYIDKIHIQLSNVMATALDDELIKKNPFISKTGITKPKSAKPDKVIDALTIEEHKAFLEQLKKKDYKYKDIFYVLFETGMRVRRGISTTKGKYRFQRKSNTR